MNIAYSLAEISCDSYLLMIVWALTPPTGHGKYLRYAWIVYYVVSQYIVRIIQYVYIRYAPIFTICQTIVDPTVSAINTAFRVSFVVSLGISLTLSVFRAKSEVVSAVGYKSVIAAIFLIFAKIVLFIPFGNDS
jgi:hypothetical protein